MIILITGASHTGKTVLAQKMLEKYGYPYLSIDHLKMGLIRSGNTNLTPEDDDALTEYLWPIVREMVKTAVENEQNLIVEGCYIPFDWRQDFDEQYLTQIRFVCLAMTAKYIENHFDEIISHESEVEARLVEADCTIAGLTADNKKYVDGFQKAGERVVIINGDYEEAIEALLQEGDDHFYEQKTCVMKDLQEMVDAEENRPESSYLEQKWMEIEDLLNDLSREPYIDDQIEIEMIWNISEELINGGHLQTETWEIREQIIQKITDNEYYDQFGVCDPMMDLIRELPQDREEKLKTAEIMWNGSGFMKKDSAKLFRELGEEGRYIQYLETHLGDEPEQYMEVVRFYEKSDPGKSEQIAELAREKCRRTYRTDLTEVYTFLVRRAYEAGDTDRLCSLFDSARRRSTVNAESLKEMWPEAAKVAADAEETKRKMKRKKQMK